MKNKKGASNQILVIIMTLILIAILIAIWFYATKDGLGNILK